MQPPVTSEARRPSSSASSGDPRLHAGSARNAVTQHHAAPRSADRLEHPVTGTSSGIRFPVVRAPSLSVVIPVYNEAPHIRATIASLAEALDRTRFDAQVIVVDDGSSDGTGEAARDAADGRLRLLVLTQPNRGRHEARLAGLAAASGELVLLLDGRVR